MQDLAEELDRARHRRPVGPRVWLAIRPLVGPTAAGLYRPRIVLFGEAMAEPDWSDALEAACRCDCMLQVGTSRTVMPAAMLPLEAKAAGARLITIDPDECPGDVWLQGTAATVLPQVVRLAFGEGAG
jgi:NAD-dependent deacetylase